MSDMVHFPQESAAALEPYLPALRPRLRQGQPTAARPTAGAEDKEADTGRSSSGSGSGSGSGPRPFVTLTFATSLDSALSMGPGIRTVLSGPESKAMTHHLRSRHDAICIGVGTAVTDDPGLNCRLEPSLRPDGHRLRPIIIDPRARWAFTEDSKVLRLAREGLGLAPFIMAASAAQASLSPRRQKLLESLGGKYIFLPYHEQKLEDGTLGLQWRDILAAVRHEGLESIMVEGGSHVIHSLLAAPDSDLVDSIIVTIAPTWLGQGSLTVSPVRRSDGKGNPVEALRLKDPCWCPMGQDVVLCGKIQR